MKSHTAQCLPVELSHLFHGTFYPKQKERKSLKKPASTARRDPDSRSTRDAHIHLLLTSVTFEVDLFQSTIAISASGAGYAPGTHRTAFLP